MKYYYLIFKYNLVHSVVATQLMTMLKEKRENTMTSYDKKN